MGLIRTFEFGDKKIVVTVDTYEYGVSIKIDDQEIAAVDFYGLVAFDEADLNHKIVTVLYAPDGDDPIALAYTDKRGVEIVAEPFAMDYEYKSDKWGYRRHTFTTRGDS